MSVPHALPHLTFLLVAGASAEQCAAELQKLIEDQTARIRSMEEQSATQAAAVAAAHGIHQSLSVALSHLLLLHLMFAFYVALCSPLSFNCVPVSLWCHLSALPRWVQLLNFCCCNHMHL